MTSAKSYAVFYKWKYEPLQKILVGVASSYELAEMVLTEDKKVHRGNGEYTIETTNFFSESA